jgi:hypothetical protein
MSKKNEVIVMPTEAEVVVLTDRLVEIDAEMKKLAVEKKGIEARLEAYALAQPEAHEPLKDASREGRRVMLGGARNRLPVVFSSDLLIQSFQDGSPKHKELLAILEGDEYTEPGQRHDLLPKFFKAPNKWEIKIEDGAKFRRCVAEWLHPETAPKFLAACRAVDKHGIAKSKTSFDYKAVEEKAETLKT